MHAHSYALAAIHRRNAPEGCESRAATALEIVQARSGELAQQSRKCLIERCFPQRPFIPPIHSQAQYVVSDKIFETTA
jgi:hypothetical protein